MLLRRDWRLVNGQTVEALPAALGRPRGNATARALARAAWLLRRKTDGRYLAAAVGTGRSGRLHLLDPLGQRYRHELAALCGRLAPAASGLEALALPVGALATALHELGLPDDYGERHGLSLVPEPAWLAFAGLDRYRRPLWLLEPAASAWTRMRRTASEDGVAIHAISGYRSHAYQLGIFRRKLARGLSVAQILAVNTAPGYSEHHSGRALDLGAPGEPPAEESFEATSAFEWLCRRAGEFGFAPSYPRGNPHEIVYEPWHWCWHG